MNFCCYFSKSEDKLPPADAWFCASYFERAWFSAADHPPHWELGAGIHGPAGQLHGPPVSAEGSRSEGPQSASGREAVQRPPGQLCGKQQRPIPEPLSQGAATRENENRVGRPTAEHQC